MIELRHDIAGTTRYIQFPECEADLDGFDAFLAGGDKVLGLDTETTGLDIYSPGHGLRLVQFGNELEAWCLRADRFPNQIRRALRQPRAFVAHNAPYDLQVIDRHLGVRIEELAPRTFDTRVMAHLLDPRAESEGGTGHGLKPLSSIYVDANAPDTQNDLTAVFRSLGFTKETGWAGVPIDEETYVRYAGLDPILTLLLFRELAPIVKGAGLDRLSQFEHVLQGYLAILQRRGMLLDVPYVEQLHGELLDEAARFKRVAQEYGVWNVNATRQVAEGLRVTGETLTEKTPSGGWKVDKAILLPLADLDQGWERLEVREPNVLADAILRSKRAEKWAMSYTQAFLDLKDADNRLHPFISALQARTARMSVSRPPLQQLPSSDWRVRRSFVADPGHVIIAADYKQVEMRVLAALSGDEAMIAAVKSGRSIHDVVAETMFGPGYTKGQYKLAKNTGFGEVFGGGATTLARQAGVSIDVAKEAKAIFADSFPGIKKYGRRLQDRAQHGKREVVTASGRHLPLDRDRLYAATNYIVQSTARDLLAQAIVDLFDKGFGDYLLLPVHDELVAQAPSESASEVVAEIGRIMESDFFGVPIESDPEVVGRSWGAGYGCPPELEAA